MMIVADSFKHSLTKGLENRDEQWLLQESQSQGSLLVLESWFQSRYQDYDSNLNSSLDIKTQNLIVLIPVLISRLKLWKSQFQSQYQDSSFKSLDSSLNIKTQVSIVSISVLISKLWSTEYYRVRRRFWHRIRLGRWYLKWQQGRFGQWWLMKRS